MPSPLSVRHAKKDNPSQEDFMQRCLQLAVLGAGHTAPNPMVGAVLVYEGRIIGEGFHEQYGMAHAEVNCIRSVLPADRHLIPASTLYVSLEPCCHQGKTPACTDLILQEKIPHVVIGCRDPFPRVNGKGIEKLLLAGIKVDYPVIEKRTAEINRRFFTFHQHHRPYIILKWAESANHKISSSKGGRIQISEDLSNRLVHQWRGEEAGILIGTNTALLDNPELTTRLWKGNNPVRIVLDQNLRLPKDLKIFDGSTRTIILNNTKDFSDGRLLYKKLNPENTAIGSILTALYALDILSLLVEGGSKMLQSFIDEGIWDETRIITNRKLNIPDGIPAPDLIGAELSNTDHFRTDTISYYINLKNNLPQKS